MVIGKFLSELPEGSKNRYAIKKTEMYENDCVTFTTKLKQKVLK